MPTEKKEKTVATLQEVFAKAEIGILTDYRGLKTPELNELRRKLKDAGIDYRVVKNSLALIAAKQTGRDFLGNSLKGPMAVAFGRGDVTKAVKAVTDYIRTSKSSLKITGGFLLDRAITEREVEAISKLPSREVLLGKVLGGMQGPVYGIVNVLAAPLRGLAQVLQARVNQMEAK